MYIYTDIFTSDLKQESGFIFNDFVIIIPHDIAYIV